MHANTLPNRSRCERRAAGMRSVGRIDMQERQMRAAGVALRRRVAMRRRFRRGRLSDGFAEQERG